MFLLLQTSSFLDCCSIILCVSLSWRDASNCMVSPLRDQQHVPPCCLQLLSVVCALSATLLTLHLLITLANNCHAHFSCDFCSTSMLSVLHVSSMPQARQDRLGSRQELVESGECGRNQFFSLRLCKHVHLHTTMS